MNRSLKRTILAACVALTVGAALAAPKGNGAARPSRSGAAAEKERPQLNEETQRLIAAYRRNPTEANRETLRRQVETDYAKVVERKKAKLKELRRTARDASLVKEMEATVDEVVRDRENRIEQTMRRFTDPRLRPGSRQAEGGYLPVLGAAQNVAIAYAPVTNEEYDRFIKATGRKAPKDWLRGSVPAGKARHPAVNVSYTDAAAYCDWLSGTGGKTRYRLPTETEWELAAGHMPKDADINNGGTVGTTPVDAYAKTLSACGAIDMWGNCWEWTSTKLRTPRMAMAVKGGSWKSPRLDCCTEQRGNGRDPSTGADDVGFRVIREN